MKKHVKCKFAHIIKLTVFSFLLYIHQALPPNVSYLNIAGAWPRAAHTSLHDSQYNAQGNGKEKSTVWPYQQLQN